MKYLLLTTIAAVLLVGCGGSIHDAALDGNIEAVKQHIADGADVNAKAKGWTPLVYAKFVYKRESPDAKAAKKEIAALLRKHGGKTSEELKAEGK